MNRIIGRLGAGEHGVRRLALLALLYSLPALGLGLQTDDHLMRWAVANGAPAWDLFHMEPQFVATRRTTGALPWWTSSNFAISFLRPLTSYTHALEFSLYPESPGVMLLVNVVLYAGAVWLAAVLYRQLLPEPGQAALAGLMFAIDEGHALSVGWIAARSALLALLFSLLALWSHLRGPSARSTLLSALFVALALLSGEAGLWSVALLLSAAFFLRGSSARAGLRSIAPQLLIFAVWAGFYLIGGHGARGSSWYRDPTQALTSGMAAAADLPLWLLGLFGPTGLSFSIFFSAPVARLVALPIALGLFFLLWPTVRFQTSSRLLLASALACLAPVVMTVPSARLLLGSSFGACGLLALAAHFPEPTTRARWTRRVLLALHVWLPLLVFPLALHATRPLEEAVQQLARAAAASEVVLLRSPFELLPSYALCQDDSCGDPEENPRTLHQLYAGGSALRVERTASNILEVTSVRGWGATPAEQIYCAADALPATGETRDLVGLRARVLASTDDGRPLRVRFTFAGQLESPGRIFLNWQHGQATVWRPPKLGQQAILAPLDVARAFSR